MERIVKINDPNYDGVLNMKTCTKIVKDGFEYKPKFSTDGLDLPIVITSGVNTSSFRIEVMYQRIPKEILKDMLREYLPEILVEMDQTKEV